MSSSSGLAGPRPGLAATREVAFLLILAAGAWVATIALARGMAGMTGTMGLGLALFVPVWTLMMAAMMLPSVAPTASPARAARMSTFGIEWGREGEAGFSAPFSWAG